MGKVTRIYKTYQEEVPFYLKSTLLQASERQTKHFITAKQRLLLLAILGLCGQAFVAGGEGREAHSFCEKLLEASPMSSGANVSWLQDGCAAGQSWAS